MENNKNNNRKRIRINLNSKIRISSKDGSSDDMKIENISHNGIALKGFFPSPKGTECDIELTLPGAESTVLKMYGTIVRNFNKNLAIAFHAIEHDSFGHLHNLIMYNANDSQAIEFEFDFPGFKRQK